MQAEREEGRDVVVVGHSLGGGVAKIIGMLTAAPTVSISGPGLFLTSTKYVSENLTQAELLHRLHTYTTNIRYSASIQLTMRTTV